MDYLKENENDICYNVSDVTDQFGRFVERYDFYDQSGGSYSVYQDQDGESWIE